MRIAIYPGSFDPVTNGHLDVIRRASRIVDKLIVAVMTNTQKNPYFPEEQRADMIRRVTADLPNVEVCHFYGLLVDFCKEKGASVVVKGLRAVSDFEYEFQMALTNRQLSSDIETVFLTTSAEYMYLSSSIVREVCMFGGDVSGLVPVELEKEIKARLFNRLAPGKAGEERTL